MKKALIVAGGSPISKENLSPYFNRYIVAADRGTDMLKEYGIRPDLIIGDMDSVSKEGEKFIEEENIKREIFPYKKNLTDTEICLEKLIKCGFKDIVLVNTRGTRFDHELASVFLLQKLYKKNINGKIIDNNNEIFYRERGTYNFSKDDKKYISIISLSHESIFSTEGMAYEVKRISIFRENPGLGVSNEIIKERASIKIHRGKVFIIKSKDWIFEILICKKLFAKAWNFW